MRSPTSSGRAAASVCHARWLAVAMGFALVAYVALNGYFYWTGFFRHWSAPVVTPTSLYLPLTAAQRTVGWSQVSYTRLPVFLATVWAMLWATRALARAAAMARLGSFFLWFGLVVPQAEFLQLHLQGFFALSPAIAIASSAALVLVPAVVLGAPGVVRSLAAHEASLPWASLAFGRARLVAFGIALCWLAFAAETYVCIWDFVPRDPGLAFALATMALCTLSVIGLLRLRTWALLTGILAAALSAGFVSMAHAALAHPCFSARDGGICLAFSLPSAGVAGALAPVPLAVIIGLTWPFLRAFATRLRS